MLLLLATPSGAQVVQTRFVLASYAVAITGTTINAGMVGDVIAGPSTSDPVTVLHGFIGGTAGALAGVPGNGMRTPLSLAPPFPSPASAGTTLRFTLAERQPSLRLEVYDIGGRRVATLARGELSAGPHASRWNLLDDRGGRVHPGLYFARLEAGSLRESRRLVVLP